MLLTIILIIPILAAVGLLFAVKDEQKDIARLIATLAAGACLVASFLVFAEMGLPNNIKTAQANAAQGRSTFLEEVNVPWVQSLGINYHVGADGTTAPM